ncbi:hypothetical protein CCACVL1_13390 [Corchorus capsularis]|uniref:Fiber protein Fb17 n=1 Tax=Corchorus capsularis TaxID=210143 RepID=A0A1R3IB71_COCAP|nr:hypothetical protein CCACVL1_13390 [Corchorus capsularis]
MDVDAQFKKMEPEFKKMQGENAKVINMNTQLQRENEELKSMVPVLESKIDELNDTLNRKETSFRTFEEVQAWLLSSSPSHNEDVANHIVHKTQGDHKTYSDELVLDFTKKLDANEKSLVEYSDFKGLMEEVGRTRMGSLPSSLAPIYLCIKNKYGEIETESKQSRCTAMPNRILLCAAIKEMNELRLEDIDEKKMLLWRDAINSALNINFKVEFAMKHLKKIARAYFGLKASYDQGCYQDQIKSLEQMMSTLRIELLELESKHAEKVKEQNSTVRKECLLDAEYFLGKTLTTGLFDY